jgi:hypothetical protein
VEAESDTAAEVERRLGRPFEEVRAQLLELFGEEWEDIEVVVETSATKRGRSRADVIVDLVGRAEEKPGVPSRVRRSLVRWIGKPWRERSNPWDRFKDRLPPVPPRTQQQAGDLDEWTPLRPDEE